MLNNLPDVLEVYRAIRKIIRKLKFQSKKLMRKKQMIGH